MNLNLSFQQIILIQILVIIVLVVSLYPSYLRSTKLTEEIASSSTSAAIPKTGDYIYDPNSPTIHTLSHQVINVNSELTIRGEKFGRTAGKIVFALVEDDDVRKEVEVLPANWSDQRIVVTIPKLEGDRTYYIRPYSNDTLLFNWTSPNIIYILPEFIEYLVQPGDSLYAIAANELGNGSRFNEIIELNRKIYPQLESSTILGIGSILRIPRE